MIPADRISINISNTTAAKGRNVEVRSPNKTITAASEMNDETTKEPNEAFKVIQLRSHPAHTRRLLNQTRQTHSHRAKCSIDQHQHHWSPAHSRGQRRTKPIDGRQTITVRHSYRHNGVFK